MAIPGSLIFDPDRIIPTAVNALKHSVRGFPPFLQMCTLYLPT